jgi:hypothetical protein
MIVQKTCSKDNACFFNPFFLPNVHHSFLKMERILTIYLIKKAKGIELMKIIFIIDSSTFGSKMLN